MQRTLVLLKPDTVQRSLVGTLLARFEQKGLKIVGLKMMTMDKALCDEHYAHMTSKPFYPAIVEFMVSGPIVALAIEGHDAVGVVRKMCGLTAESEWVTGTIRGDYARSIDNNLIHSSDSLETAAVEVERFFRSEELFSYGRNFHY
jgi:nucleoside-diphosphate kinase